MSDNSMFLRFCEAVKTYTQFGNQPAPTIDEAMQAIHDRIAAMPVAKPIVSRDQFMDDVRKTVQEMMDDPAIRSQVLKNPFAAPSREKCPHCHGAKDVGQACPYCDLG